MKLVYKFQIFSNAESYNCPQKVNSINERTTCKKASENKRKREKERGERERKRAGEIAARPFFELFELCKCPGLITPTSAHRFVRCFAFDARTRQTRLICVFYPLSLFFFISSTVIVFARWYGLPDLLRSLIASFFFFYRERDFFPYNKYTITKCRKRRKSEEMPPSAHDN